MADLLIRDLDPTVHRELKRRADQERVSLQAYVSRVLGQHAGRPTIAQWLHALDGLPRHPDISGAEAVRDARGDAP